MKVFYRLTEIASSNPSPIYQDDKKRLNKMCLKSFVNAFKDLQPQIFFFCDHCDDPEMTDYMIQSVVPWKFSTEYMNVGINQTMLISYELAKNYNDYVLFQECDYLYRPGIGRTFFDALNNFKVVSPYDHKNFYIDETLHSKDIKIDLVSNHHFRTTERNTMTWGCHGNLILKYYDIFVKHGYLDSQLWYDLKDEGIQMWVPIPAMATHMADGWLAPGVDWQSIWREL
jgi:hypothetical protein